MSPAARAMSLACAGLLVMLAAGCGGPSAGKPVPVATTVTDSSAPATPTRPRELRLDNVDPCGLVSKSDWPTFYIEKPGESKHNDLYDSVECTYINNTGLFSIMLVVTEGIEAWLGGQRMGEAGEIDPVAGFPAITVILPADKKRCDVLVDVADGQYLDATIIVFNSRLSEVSEVCEYAHQLAESAMKTLVGP